LTAIVSELTEEISTAVLSKKFNFLGGLQFGNDIQKITEYFTRRTPKSLRQKFRKLNEIKELLILEKVSDVLEYWGDNLNSEIKWLLTPDEAKKFLKLRSDLPANAIEKLKLL